MSAYKLELSEIEKACGVTLEAVAEELPRCLMRNELVFMSRTLAQLWRVRLLGVPLLGMRSMSE